MDSALLLIRQRDTLIVFRHSSDCYRKRREIFPAWRKLVLEHRVSGIHVHDARIIAAMTVHQVESILTFDLGDFKRYGHITPVDPKSL
jgi:predicted nucleic acid-binding protein